MATSAGSSAAGIAIDPAVLPILVQLDVVPPLLVLPLTWACSTSACEMMAGRNNANRQRPPPFFFLFFSGRSAVLIDRPPTTKTAATRERRSAKTTTKFCCLIVAVNPLVVPIQLRRSGGIDKKGDSKHQASRASRTLRAHHRFPRTSSESLYFPRLTLSYTFTHSCLYLVFAERRGTPRSYASSTSEWSFRCSQHIASATIVVQLPCCHHRPPKSHFLLLLRELLAPS